MKEPAVPEKAAKEIQQALRALRSPKELSVSSWASSCLVSKRLCEAPELTKSQAVKAVFTGVLEFMQKEHPRHAEILHGRFWQGFTATKMIVDGRPTPVERTFYDYQKEALEQFIFLLWEREQACKQNAQTEGGAVSDLEASAGNPLSAPLSLSPPEKERPKAVWASRYLPFIVVALLVAITIIVSSWIIKSKTQMATAPTLSNSSSPPPALTATVQIPTLAATAVNSSAPITAVATTPICSEPTNIPFDGDKQFLRHQGVAFYDVEHTSGGVEHNFVRALAIDPQGVWFGYYVEGDNTANSFGQYPGSDNWVKCGVVGAASGIDVNDMAIDHKGNVWISTESAGILMFDGQSLHNFTADNADELKSNEGFKITIDEEDNVWVGTWEGVAKYDGTSWSLPFTIYDQDKTIFNNHVHVIAFGGQGDIWVGYVEKGVSFYNHAKKEWEYLTPQNSGLSGIRIRDIVVQKIDETSEAIWIATVDGGISKFDQGKWTVYRTENKAGFPSNEVHDLAIDKYNRVWAATSGGVVYFNGQGWTIYDTLDTRSIAFSPANCAKPACVFDNDHVWTGTKNNGLTHTRIPFTDAGVSVSEVCFSPVLTQERKCVTPIEDKAQNAVVATYPGVVKPGEAFWFEVVVSPLASHELNQQFGDYLSNTDENEEQLFGAFYKRPVEGQIVAGQSFRFSDLDNPLTAPTLNADVQEATFTSTWRVWMRTRYVGPYIQLKFTVQRP